MYIYICVYICIHIYVAPDTPLWLHSHQITYQNTLQHTATHLTHLTHFLGHTPHDNQCRNTLQLTATHCNTLQHTWHASLATLSSEINWSEDCPGKKRSLRGPSHQILGGSAELLGLTPDSFAACMVEILTSQFTTNFTTSNDHSADFLRIYSWRPERTIGIKFQRIDGLHDKFSARH